METFGAGVRDGRLSYLRGEVLMRQGAADLAAESYEQAIELGFDRYWAHRRCAEARTELQLNDVADRLAAAEVAVNPEALRDVLKPLLAEGRPPLSARTLDRVDVLAGSDAELAQLIQAMRSRYAADGSAEDGDADLAASAGTKLEGVWRRFERGDYPDALRLSREAIGANRLALVRLAHAHYLAAESLYRLGEDLRQAETDYSAALELGFDPYLAHLGRGRLRLELSDEAGARSDLRAAFAAAPDEARGKVATEALAGATSGLADA